MINSNIINNRQNEDQYLKIQYAARKCFNLAEKVNYLCWVLCLLSALMVLIPEGTTKYITVGLPILLDVVAAITVFIFNDKVKNGANLRIFFDSQVLMINEGSYTDIDKQKLKELALNIYQKNKSEAEISIHNTGRDNPPGVRNWYEFKNNANGVHAQFECQRQNIWWNEKMIKNRRVCLLLSVVTLLIACVLMFILLKTDILNIIACSVGIFLKLTERIVEHKKYYDISIKIDAIQYHIENHLTTDDIVKLQALIDERRNIPVLEINLIHRKKAKKFSSSYEETS